MKGETFNEKLAAWMMTVITHPQGVSVGANTEAAQNLLPNAIEEVINPSQRLSSTERLSIYQRAYYARLLECFSAEYPALQHLLGEDIFKAFVFEYLQYHPSRSYTLNQLGAQFPTYLAQTQPAGNSEDVSWINLILELTSLERAYTEVYDGPGHENHQLPNADHILRKGLNHFSQLRLVPAVCVRLFAFQYPVHSYLMAVRKGLAPTETPQPQPTFVVLTRRKYILGFFAISQLDYLLLHSLFAGNTIEEAIAQLPTALAQTPAAALTAIRSRICTLADEGIFQSIG